MEMAAPSWFAKFLLNWNFARCLISADLTFSLKLEYYGYALTGKMIKLAEILNRRDYIKGTLQGEAVMASPCCFCVTFFKK